MRKPVSHARAGSACRRLAHDTIIRCMRDAFRGYYSPTEEEFKTLWEQATFVMDANVNFRYLLLKAQRIAATGTKSC